MSATAWPPAVREAAAALESHLRLCPECSNADERVPICALMQPAAKRILRAALAAHDEEEEK